MEVQIPLLKYCNYQFFFINRLNSTLVKVLEEIYTTIKEDLKSYYLPIHNQNRRHNRKRSAEF